MIVYLKNQSNYKMKDFEGISYDEIRLIFEKIWDFNHNFVPMDLGVEKEKKKPVELDDEKEDLKGYLDIVPREDVAEDVESLCTKQDIMELYRLVKERYSSSKPEGYDLMLWGDLHTLFEPDEESEIWMNQNEYNLISWSLCDFCGVHILLMQNGIAIHMLTEKKYPLSQEMISKMLSKRLEVDQESTQAYELLKFIRSQVKKQDIMELYRLVKERYSSSKPEGYDLMLKEKAPLSQVHQITSAEVEECFESSLSEDKEDFNPEETWDLKINHKFRGGLLGINLHQELILPRLLLKFPNQEFREHLPHDELVSFVEQLGYIGSMMNDAIRNSAHYLTYLALSTNIETEKKKDTVPRKKRSFTAADNILPNLDKAVKLAELIRKADEEKGCVDETAAEEKTRDEKAEDEKVEEEKAKDKKAVEEKVIEEQAGDEQIRVIVPKPQ
ncbi:hypothetical protein Tco_0228825 [Tanacetum coccineum]